MSQTDFRKLQELDRMWKSGKPEMFDQPPVDLYGTNLNPNLTEEEIEDALFWKKYQRGYWLLISPPGSGKGALSNMVAYKMKHYFGKTPIMDYKPCQPFGYYEFLDTKVLISELDKMTEGTKVKTEKERKGVTEEAAESWVLDRQHMFRHSTLVLDEFTRYFDRRRHNNQVGITLSHLFTIWRHLDILIIGVATSDKYLDFRAYEELTAKVGCSWSLTRKMTYMAFIHPVKFAEATGVLVHTGFPDVLVVNIENPQPMLDGYAWKDLFNTEQDISLSIPKSLRKEQ